MPAVTASTRGAVTLPGYEHIRAVRCAQGTAFAPLPLHPFVRSPSLAYLAVADSAAVLPSQLIEFTNDTTVRGRAERPSQLSKPIWPMAKIRSRPTLLGLGLISARSYSSAYRGGTGRAWLTALRQLRHKWFQLKKTLHRFGNLASDRPEAMAGRLSVAGPKPLG